MIKEMLEKHKTFPYAHRDLVIKMAVWARQYFHCSCVLTEQKSYYTREIPDILAFKTNGYSYSFEVKVSRSDFFKDGNKISNQEWNKSYKMGDSKYFVVPEYMIELDEVPDGYGIIFVNRKLQCRVVQRKGWQSHTPATKEEHERKMMEFRTLLSNVAFNQNPDNGFTAPDNPFRVCYRQFDVFKSLLKAIKPYQDTLKL